jgi:hypothetical protein
MKSFTKYPKHSITCAVASLNDLSWQELQGIAKTSSDVRTLRKILKEYDENPDHVYVLDWLGCNKNLPPEFEQILCDLDYKLIHSTLARYSRYPETLRKLYDLYIEFPNPSRKNYILAVIAGNVRTPVDVLAALSNYPEKVVRRELLHNKSLPDELKATMKRN